MTGAPVRLRPEIAALASYRQGRAARPGGFKLSSNENPFPTHPAVLEAIAESALNRYPDGTASALRSQLAGRYGLDPGQVHVGAGSVSLLAQLITAAAGAGDEVVFAWRSFEAYPPLVTVAGAEAVPVPLLHDGSHDLPAMAAAVTERTRVVIVCSPNNPTGAVVTAEAFAAFLQALPADVLVLLDEAYAEFDLQGAGVRGIPLLSRHPNLVVLRTFSKAFGLAGLRVGYALGDPRVLDAARSAAIPLAVTEPAQRAAIAALEHEQELLEQVRALARLRDEVWEALAAQGWNTPRPYGNFVWLPTGERTAEAAEAFAEAGIVVRAFPPDGIRVTVAEPDAVATLLEVAGEVVRSLRRAPTERALD